MLDTILIRSSRDAPNTYILCFFRSLTDSFRFPLLRDSLEIFRRLSPDESLETDVILFFIAKAICLKLILQIFTLVRRMNWVYLKLNIPYR